MIRTFNQVELISLLDSVYAGVNFAGKHQLSWKLSNEICVVIVTAILSEPNNDFLYGYSKGFNLMYAVICLHPLGCLTS